MDIIYINREEKLKVVNAVGVIGGYRYEFHEDNFILGVVSSNGNTYALEQMTSMEKYIFKNIVSLMMLEGENFDIRGRVIEFTDSDLISLCCSSAINTEEEPSSVPIEEVEEEVEEEPSTGGAFIQRVISSTQANAPISQATIIISWDDNIKYAFTDAQGVVNMPSFGLTELDEVRIVVEKEGRSFLPVGMDGAQYEDISFAQILVTAELEAQPPSDDIGIL